MRYDPDSILNINNVHKVVFATERIFSNPQPQKRTEILHHPRQENRTVKNAKQRLQVRKEPTAVGIQ